MLIENIVLTGAGWAAAGFVRRKVEGRGIFAANRANGRELGGNELGF
jgi:hypothetical protein